MRWMIMPLRRYAEFTGRSRRMEYWMFTLFQWLIYIAILLVAMTILFAGGSFDAVNSRTGDAAAGVAVMLLLGLFAFIWLAFLVPNLAVIARRLQDQNIPGWVGILLYLSAIFIGFTGLVLLVFSFIPGTTGHNDYGPDPKQTGRDSDIFT